MSKWFVRGFIFLALTLGLAAQSAQEDLILRAEDAFQREAYGEAANLYQEAAERGAVNAYVYYNQGNSWYMGGEHFLALLSYLKAESLRPGDGDIKKSLSFIRSLVGEELEDSSQGEFIRVLFFWHYDLSLRLRAVLLLLFNLLFWGGWMLRLVLEKNKPFWKGALIITGAMAFMVGVSLFLGVRQEKTHPAGVILQETSARKGDGPSFEEAFNRPLSGGTEFTLEETRGGWYRIRLKDGSEGWIEADKAGLVTFP